MFRIYSNCSDRLFEGYQRMILHYCKQNAEKILIFVRILWIINGMQEIHMLIDPDNYTNTKSIVEFINQFDITIYLFNVQSSQIQISIFIMAFNLISTTLIFLQNNTKLFYRFTLIWVIGQFQILTIPQIKYLARIQTDQQSSIILVTVNLLFLYFHQFLWIYNNRQTQLIEIQGFITESHLQIEILTTLLTIFAVIFHEISIYLVFISLIANYLIKIFLSISSRNQNNQFMIVLMSIKLIIAISLVLQLQILYLLIISSIFLLLIFQLQERLLSLSLFHPKISLQICQLLHIISYSSESQKYQFYKLLLLRRINMITNNPIDYCLKQLILTELDQKYNLISKIYSNYISNRNPLISIIYLKKHENSANIFERAYSKVNQQLLNQQVRLLQPQTQRNSNSNQQDMDQLKVSSVAISNSYAEKSMYLLQKQISKKLDFFTQIKTMETGSGLQFSESIEKITLGTQEITEYMKQNYDLTNLKLKLIDQKDILSLRILQIYYGVEMNDYEIANLIEKQISDLLRQDSNMHQGISNKIVALNQLLMLSTSLTKDKGKLINYDYNQAAKFLNCEVLQVQQHKYIHEFMPDFVAEVHDELLDNYIQRGTSQLSQKGKLTFIRDNNMSLIPCFINIWNPLYVHDLILHAIFVKEYKSEYILFGSDGKIHGMTPIFQEFIGKDVSKLFGRQNNIWDILKRIGMIQFYIPQIYDHVLGLQKSIKLSQNHLLENLKSYWQFPENQGECQIQSELLEFSIEKQNEDPIFQIQDQYIPLINMDLNEIIKNIPKYPTQKTYQNKSVFELTHSLSTMTIKKKLLFVIQIKEFKLLNQASISSFSQLSQNNSNVQTSQMDEIIESESQLSGVNHIQEIRSLRVQEHQKYIVNQLLEQQDECEIIDISQSKQIMNASQYKLSSVQTQRLSNRQLISFRQQSSFQMPQLKISQKFNSDLDIMESIELDMKAFQQQSEQQQQQQQQQLQQSQQKCLNQEEEMEDINHKYLQSASQKSLKKEQTYNSAQQHLILCDMEEIKKIVYKNNNIILTRQSIFQLIIMYTLLLGSLLIIQMLINNNVINLQNQVNTIRPFQGLNFVYASAFINFWNLYLEQQQVYNFSSQLSQGILNAYKFTLQYSSSYQRDFQIYTCINRFNDQFQDLFGDQDYCIQNMINAQQLQINPYNELLLTGLLDFGNFEADSQYAQEIVPIIVYQYFQTEMYLKYNQSYDLDPKFLMVLIIVVGFVVLGLTLEIFMINNQNQLQIQFFGLMRRLNENDINEQIAKFSSVKESFKDENWRLTNFAAIMNYEVKIVNKIISIKQKQSNKLKRADLEKNTIIGVALVFKIVKSMILGIFFLGGYLLHQKEHENYIPSVQIINNFIFFKQALDTSSVLGQLIKTLPLFNSTKSVEQQQIIKQFTEITDSLPDLLRNITQVLVDSSFLMDTTKKQLIQAFSNDLCTLYPQKLNFCDSTQLERFEDSYKIQLTNGVNGFVSSLVQYVIQEFNYEQQHNQFLQNKVELYQSIHSAVFKNIFIEYFVDIQSVVYDMFSLFDLGNTEAGNALSTQMLKYYISFGIILQFVIIFVEGILVWRMNRKISTLKYLILLLPTSKFSDPVLKQKMKVIQKNFN